MSLGGQVRERHPILVPQPVDESNQFLPLLGHGGVEAGPHVVREEFENKGALVVVGHRATTGFQFVHKLISQRAVTGAGFGELFFDLLVGLKSLLYGGGFKSAIGFASRVDSVELGRQFANFNLIGLGRGSVLTQSLFQFGSR